MKFALILTALLISQFSFAQSANEKKIKKEMVDRAELLIEKVRAAREDLDQEDVVSACVKIQEIFKLYPEHLSGIGTHLDLERSRTIKAKDTALDQLKEMDKKAALCKRGKDSEFVDAKKMRKELKVSLKLLKKQRRVIKTLDTGSSNLFWYEYSY